MEQVTIGNGSVARELIAQMGDRNIKCFVDRRFISDAMSAELPIEEFNPDTMEAIVAVGDPIIRSGVVPSLPKNTSFFSYIDPRANVFGSDIDVGEGTIISAGAIVMVSARLGRHTYINRNTMVGHETYIDDLGTLVTGAVVSGNCRLGEFVALGANASIQEGITVCDSGRIGMQAAVVRDFVDLGTYVGVTARLKN